VHSEIRVRACERGKQRAGCQEIKRERERERERERDRERETERERERARKKV
jgi:hypothetical protein